ncbi:MAG: helix-turn-helix domain-containing protein [Alphaproteobacteria bacterium]|nr:helix-turn-helix domain-containing protein [Alphaproteobacteria bacterium]MBV9694283.1 helix-turn-helix domain-containing protein [Alphaproteobacteria bacterium]
MSFVGTASSQPVPFAVVRAAAADADMPAELETAGTVCNFAPAETIFGEGDPIDASYRVLSGVVRLCRLTADGRRQIAGFRLPGDLIGIEWTGAYDMTAEAVRNVTCVRYSRSRLDRLSHEKAEVRDHLLSHLCRDLRSAQEHLMTLGCQSAIERVASFLLQTARRASASDGSVIDMQLGRQDIADYLGLTLETVSRTFTELAGRGLIATPKRRHVVIRNGARLKAASLPLH